MDADKVAIGGLVTGAVGAVAACIAAWYAYKAPLQADLKRVEDNTARTTTELAEVHGHIEQVEEHLRLQNETEALVILGQQVSMRVHGEAWTAEPMELAFELDNPKIPLIRIDLVTGAELFIASFPCAKVSDVKFTAVITAEAFGEWFIGGEVFDTSQSRVVSIHAILDANGHDTKRCFRVRAMSALRQGPKCMTYFNRVQGQC